MKTFLRIFFLLFVSYNIAFSQPVTWQRIFGGPRNDYAYDLFQTIDGNFLMLGERSVISLNTGFYIPQTYLVKFNIYGNILWQKYFGDSIKPNYSVSALEMPSGNILITYVNNNIGNLMKVDSYGNLIWDKHYPNPISGFYYLSFIDNKKNIIINGDQIGGLSYIPNITKLDTNGNLIWTKGFNDSAEHRGFYNSDIGYYSVGAKSNSSSYIDKRDTSGNLIWRKIFNNPYGNNVFLLNSITTVSPTTYIAIGKICSLTQCSLFAIKIDSAGNSIWQKEYFNDYISGVKIIKTLNNNLAIAGGYVIGKGLLSIIDSLGNIVMKRFHYYSSPNAIYYDYINNASDSGFLVCGSFEAIPGNYSEFLVVKTDKNLNIKTTRVINENLYVNNYEFNFELYPNPFNPTVNIKINLNLSERINIKLYDINGREIKTLLNRILPSGENIYSFNISELNLSSGIYIFKVSNESISQTKKVVFLK